MPKAAADHAFDAATCIGCGACVAACPNGSAMLFTAAKVTHLGLLPQGQPERKSRVVGMVTTHDEEGFGGCTNIGECTAVCPKGIPLETISRLNRDLLGRDGQSPDLSAAYAKRLGGESFDAGLGQIICGWMKSPSVVSKVPGVSIPQLTATVIISRSFTWVTAGALPVEVLGVLGARLSRTRPSRPGLARPRRRSVVSRRLWSLSMP